MCVSALGDLSDDLQAESSSLDLRVTQVEQDSADNDVGDLERRVGTLEGTTNTQEVRLAEVESDLDSLEPRITAVENDVQGKKEFMDTQFSIISPSGVTTRWGSRIQGVDRENRSSDNGQGFSRAWSKRHRNRGSVVGKLVFFSGTVLLAYFPVRNIWLVLPDWFTPDSFVLFSLCRFARTFGGCSEPDCRSYVESLRDGDVRLLQHHVPGGESWNSGGRHCGPRGQARPRTGWHQGIGHQTIHCWRRYRRYLCIEVSDQIRDHWTQCVHDSLFRHNVYFVWI